MSFFILSERWDQIGIFSLPLKDSQLIFDGFYLLIILFSFFFVNLFPDAQYMDFPAVLDYTKNKIGLVLSGFPTSLEECYKEAGVER